MYEKHNQEDFAQYYRIFSLSAELRYYAAFSFAAERNSKLGWLVALYDDYLTSSKGKAVSY